MRITSVILGQLSVLTAEGATRGGKSGTFGGLGKPLSVNVPNPYVRTLANDSFGESVTPQGQVNALLDKIRHTLASGAGDGADSISYSRQSSNSAVPFSRTSSRSRSVVTGVNASQISSTHLQGVNFGGAFTIRGEVSRAAGSARLTVSGASGATATAGGTYVLSGSRGSITLELEAGESLHDVAARINDHSWETGVTASVAANNLVLASSEKGSAATVQLEPLDIETIETSGVNAGQIDEFEVSSFSSGATETISGSVVSTVQGAELVYHGGTGGTVNGTAAFQLTGTRGTASVSITEGELLSAVAQRINEQTASTGVVAEVDRDDLNLTSDTFGAAAVVRVDSVALDHDTNISGVNPAQVTDLEVVSLADGSEHVLTGQVTRAASKAAVHLQGAGNATVIDSGAFEISGSEGTATIAITEGESLASVADRVNAESETTGVTASVVGTQLKFQSVAAGSSGEVSVELLDIAHTTVVSGVNSQQLSAFQVHDFTQGATHSLSGSVTQTAGKAELTFTGFTVFVGTSGTFTLSGSLGSVQLTTSSLQTLASLASQVNSNSGTTGVTATVQGSQLKLRSVGVGSAATVGVNVISGSFNVTGGNGNGTANGANAVAIVNGQTVTGLGNQFQLTDALGSYSFTTVSGFTGALSSVNIESQAGSFELSGGNGNGTATGLDALAVINSVSLTGVGNRFTVSQPGGEFELEFADGFTGQFDAITVESTPDAFEIAGGDGTGAAFGTDTVALVNGIEYRSTDTGISIAGAHGNYAIQFAAGFVGSFDSITVESVIDSLVTDGDENGLASGNDAEAVINGQEYVGTGSQFQHTQNGLRITFDFRPGFAGAFDPITVSQPKRSEAFRSTPTPLETPESPTDAVLDQPLDSLLQELDDLVATAQADPADGPENGSQPAADNPLTKAELLRNLFTSFHPFTQREESQVDTLRTTLDQNLRLGLDLRA